MIRGLRSITILTFLLLVCAAISVRAQEQRSDDVAMELVGQVTNPSPTSSFQVGYLTYINGIDAPIFSAVPQNEASAFFTFRADNTTTRVINNGAIRVINRQGSISFYYNAAPSGNFSNPGTFSSGQAVMTADLRHQVIVDTVTGAFTATFVLTVKSNDPFVFNGQQLRMGNVGDKLRLTFNGHLNSPAPPSGYIAGFVVGNSLITVED